MTIHNLPLLRSALGTNSPTVKFQMNDSEIAFFPASLQHRDVKPGGLSYEDDYKGNALAGLIVSGKPEIRFHSAFSDDRVRNLWHQLRSAPECAGLPIGNPTYQGRPL